MLVNDPSECCAKVLNSGCVKNPCKLGIVFRFDGGQSFEKIADKMIQVEDTLDMPQVDIFALIEGSVQMTVPVSHANAQQSSSLGKLDLQAASDCRKRPRMPIDKEA